MGKMMKQTHFSARDFSVKVRNGLSRKGIQIIGTCSIPDMSHPMPYANASRAYQLDDNGTGRIRSHAEVVAMGAS